MSLKLLKTQKTAQDASFAGQGVVYETMQLAHVKDVGSGRGHRSPANIQHWNDHPKGQVDIDVTHTQEARGSPEKPVL